MNKRIYYQNKFIEFATEHSQTQQNQAIKIIEGPVDEGMMRKILNNFIVSQNLESYQLPLESFAAFFELAKTDLHYIEAAGGLIEKNKEYLCIHRLSRWDLPKGKREKGESIEECAIRECEEECGISELEISHPLSSTFHIYPFKNGMAIKQSYWFYMRSTYAKKLKPQTEENIDEVTWFTRQEIEMRVLQDTYYTIHDVITEALNLP